MIISHIVCTFPPYNGGMGNVAFEMVRALQEKGHDLRVYTPQYYAAEEIRPKEALEIDHNEDVTKQIKQVNRLDPKLKYGNAAYLPNIIDELHDVDIVHLHYPFYGTANLIRKWKKKYPQKKLVVSYHMDPRAMGYKGLIFKIYGHFWMPKIIASADAVIAASFDYIQHADAALVYKKNRAKWYEVPFGVDTERFQYREKDMQLIEKHGLNLEQPILLFVGGMDKAHYFKGIPILLRALAILKRQQRLPQVVLVGDGNLREEYMLFAKGLGIANDIIFTGRISEPELPLYYNLADLFVLPSINQGEAFGMVLLEAMASGVPVVASDLPGVRTVANQGGITSNVNNPAALAGALIAMLDNAYNQSDKQKLAQNTKEKYSWNKVADELDNIYSTLVY